MTENDVDIRAIKTTAHMKAIKQFYESCGYSGPVKESDQIILARNKNQIIGVVRLVEENGQHAVKKLYSFMQCLFQRRFSLGDPSES